jgi:hypothetical protein
VRTFLLESVTMSTSGIVFFVVCGFLLFGLAIYGTIKFWTNPNLERYLKQRMQGPFVPLSKDEITKT